MDIENADMRAEIVRLDQIQVMGEDALKTQQQEIAALKAQVAMLQEMLVRVSKEYESVCLTARQFSQVISERNGRDAEVNRLVETVVRQNAQTTLMARGIAKSLVKNFGPRAMACKDCGNTECRCPGDSLLRDIGSGKI